MNYKEHIEMFNQSVKETKGGVFGFPIKYKEYTFMFIRRNNTITYDIVNKIMEMIKINYEEIKEIMENNLNLGILEVWISEDGTKYGVYLFSNLIFGGEINVGDS